MKKHVDRLSRSEWLGFLGLLGFMGFLRSYTREPQYVFFAFFGYFSYFFIGRIQRQTPDERMVYNYQRAQLSMNRFFSILLALTWVLVILNHTVFHIQYLPVKTIELVVALVFAASLILQAFLVYYYDQVE